MACESVLPYLRDWLMPPAAVPAGYARRVHIAFDYRAYRARCGRPTVRHADAQARLFGRPAHRRQDAARPFPPDEDEPRVRRRR